MSHDPITNTGPAQPEIIANYNCEIGENPLWHPIEQRLYWTDISTGRLFRYFPSTNKHEQCYQDRPVGGFTIQADGALLLFMDRGTVALWREGVMTEIVPEIPIEREFRFNDVIADPRGRVFCGTVPNGDGKGRLYRLDVDGSLHLLLDGIGCANGMAFTPDRKGFYFTDSLAYEIYLFDYNIESGSIANRRVFAHFDEAGVLPDGATLDAEGRLWTALWGGSCIARLNSDGAIAEKIILPTCKVSSLTYGGNDFSDIYITTAAGDAREAADPLAGALFRIKAQIPGVAEFFSRIESPPSALKKTAG
jgi:sugar lactone lactonase YvrE